MSNKIYTITSPRDDRVFIHAMPGHYVTASSHINYYIGTSDIKHAHESSVDTAMLMSSYYNEKGVEVDTVLCLYETQPLGAYLAHELSRPSMLNPNPTGNIFVLSPEYDATGNMIFRDNLKRMIENKNVVLLISCITSGKTLERAMESVAYYGGKTVGISAIFSAVEKIGNVDVNAIFTQEDVPDYKATPAHDCPLCKAGVPVDAMINGFGYSKI